MQIGFFKRENLRMLGIYLIIILVFLRFVLWPLSSSVGEKKALLKEYIETYRTKTILAQRRKLGDVTIENSVSEQEGELLASLYPKESHFSEIQPDTVVSIMEIAEKNGLSMINFELPEVLPSRNLSEIPVLVRLSGMPENIIKLLKEINKMKMLTDVKLLQLTRRANRFTLILTLTTYKIES